MLLPNPDALISLTCITFFAAWVSSADCTGNRNHVPPNSTSD